MRRGGAAYPRDAPYSRTMASTTREIARDSIRRRLAQVVLQQVIEHGFESVTLPSLAEAAGVSRSTLLRYVGSKAEAVVGSLMEIGAAVADDLRARPAGEHPWLALRHAMDRIISGHTRAGVRTADLTRTIYTDSALAGAMWLQRDTWASQLHVALRDREPDAAPADLRALAFAAIACLDTAAHAWLEDQASDFGAHLDAAFAAVAAVGRTGPDAGAG